MCAGHCPAHSYQKKISRVRISCHIFQLISVRYQCQHIPWILTRVGYRVSQSCGVLGATPEGTIGNPISGNPTLTHIHNNYIYTKFRKLCDRHIINCDCNRIQITRSQICTISSDCENDNGHCLCC